MDLSRLGRSFLEGPVVDMDGYQYFVTSLADGIPRIDAGLLNEVLDGLIAESNLDCDLILAPEAMGIPLATGLTLRTGIPFSVIRKKGYGLPGEISFEQRTGYSGSTMHVNCVRPGERVALVDDVIDTGGTAKATIEALRNAEIVVTEMLVVFNRCTDVCALSKELGVPIRYLMTVGTEDGEPVIIERGVRMDAGTALEKLKEGNRRYVSDEGRGDYSAEIRRATSENGQSPYAIVVCCSDSRVVPEAAFSASLGDLFVIRVAGNVIDRHQLGSIEYAAEHLSCRLVLVLGHDRCGAVDAAINHDPDGHIAYITREILSAIGEVRDPDAACRLNALHSVRMIEKGLRIERMEGICVKAAIYHIGTGEVEFL